MEPVTLGTLTEAVGGRLRPARSAPLTVEHVVIDSRHARPGTLFIALPGGRTDGARFGGDARQRGAVAAVASRALPELATLEVADPAVALQQIGAFNRSRRAVPVIGVTGSNGKTTVKEILAAILQQKGPGVATRGNLNNLLGVPLTLTEIEPDHAWAVIEMGANHPGEIESLTALARPQIGVVTQAAPAHLEGFGSVAGVARAKGELFEGLPGDGVAVINADDPHASLWHEQAGGRRVVTFGRDRADVHVAWRGAADALALRLPPGPDAAPGEGAWYPAPTALVGEHNGANAAAAAACALAAGCDVATVLAGIARVEPHPGRLNLRRGVGGVRVLDDSYNANPASLAAGLQALSQWPAPRWALLGAMGELGADADEWHRQAGRDARAAGIERLWVVGDAAPAANAFGAGSRVFPELVDLVAALRSDPPPDGATVLIKGSRSAGMEAAVQVLCPATDGPGSTEQGMR